MRKLDGEKLVIATHNAGKLREMEELLAPFGLAAQSLAELNLPVPAETGTKFEQNAYIKAAAAAKAAGLPALADDSGLEVDALAGAPGVYTADWAEQPDGSRDFTKAMALVEQRLEAALADKHNAAAQKAARHGRFISVLCLAWPDGHAEYYRGEIEGEIIWPPRGDKGFGYDPIFQPEGEARSFGEMTAAEKHGWQPWQQRALSHRARAFKKLAEAQLQDRRRQ